MEKAVKPKKVPMDLCTRPLLKKTVLFALPLVLTSVLQLLYNAADIIVLGRWAGDESEAAVGAVGSTGALINLITNLFIGLSVGALAIVARYVGARDNDKIQKSVHTSLIVSVIGGVAVGIIGFFLSGVMLKLMNTPENVLPLSALYLKIYFCGMPFNLIYNFGANILRACGDTRRPLIILALSGVVNIALNILTVAVFKMSVAGVGIATTASQAVSAAGVTVALLMRRDAAKLIFKKLRIHKASLVDIIKIGLPAGIQSTVFSFSNVIIQSSINGFGDVAVTGNATAANIEGFVYVAMNAVAQSCLTVAGQNYGAAKPKNIDLTLMQCLMLASGVGLVLGVGAYFLASPLLKLYGISGEALSYGAERMSIVCTFYFMCGVMEVLVGVLRGIGRSVMPMIVSVLGVVGVRILWIYTVFRMNHTLVMLYVSYPISWLFTLAVHLICYLAVRKKTFARLNAMRAAAENSGGEPQTDNVSDSERQTEKISEQGEEI